MAVTVLILASVLLGQSPAAPKKPYPDLFESRECRFADEQGQPQVAGYQLFVPREPEEGRQAPHSANSSESSQMSVRSQSPFSTERYPLLVFPVFGDWLNSLLLTDPQHPDKYRFFVLVIGSADNFDKILEDIVCAYPVDRDRVYLAGVSRGGYVCTEIAQRHPELIAAVAPLAGGAAEQAANLIETPIWAFVNRSDQPYRDHLEQLTATVRLLGGNAHLTILPADGHDGWSAAFHQYNIMTWLLEQRRGGPYWRLPGQEPWQWWHIVTLPCILLVFVRLAWSVEQWRRRRNQRRAALAELEAAEADFCLDNSLFENEPAESFEDRENPEQH